ncbi:hypothetical protein [Saccharopolyspora elongata]|uniref:Uncharacterized protein n=1 Tax=Saccharopolyspora elongata TaxID=2530387 RepID=A0A4V2YIM4_9PSEU|nr:hypothetical protein [Saccharopolyspora elongata]TDD35497.1 hypothetical protein E1288_43130 [Saccharopolyspora elongata]
MTEPTRRRQRPRRSTAASQQLEKMRQANAAQRAAYLAREERVEEALVEYAHGMAEIQAAESLRDDKVTRLQRKIDELKANTEKKVVAARDRQAAAAWVIHCADRTVEQVGETLHVSEREARRLIAAGRKAADADEERQETDSLQATSGSRPEAATQDPEPSTPSSRSEEQHPSTTEPGHDGTYPIGTPSIPDEGDYDM